jgi:hypothetical protein
MALGRCCFPDWRGAAERAAMPGAKASALRAEGESACFACSRARVSRTSICSTTKPTLHKFAGQEIPASVKGTQRLTGMTSGQKAYPVVRRCRRQALRQARTWISDLLPHTQTIADEICIIKSMYTGGDQPRPAITYMNTGNQQPGYASMGSGMGELRALGSENKNLPAFIAMVSQGTGKNPGQPIFSRLWGSGFCRQSHQGVGLRPGANPVLFLKNPTASTRTQRRELLDDLAKLNQLRAARLAIRRRSRGSTPTRWRIGCKCPVPELTDISGESS